MFKLRKYLTIIVMLITLAFSGVVVYASESTRQEGEIYQGDDGKYYQIINGRPFEIDNGSASDGSITDAFKDYSKTTTPDAEVMNDVNARVISPIGTAISFIIYLIFAFTAFTTVVDLAWIALPPIRPFLYDGNSANNVGTANANLLGRNEGWTQAANNRMNSAGQHNMQAQAYAQQAQNLAATGDSRGAQRAMHMANSQAQMAQDNIRHANNDMREQARSDAWRTEANQRTLNNAQRRAENNRGN